MGFEHGFKTWANKIAEQTRAEMGLRPLEPLNPRELASSLSIPIFDVTSLLQDAPAVAHLLTTEVEVFSAVTVFHGHRRAITHNDKHAITRQNSNIAHELSHGLLLHPPTPAMDDRGNRYWNSDIEDEAKWLSGCLLVTEAATMAIARGKWTIPEAAMRLAVSSSMIQYRLNSTGARARVARGQR